MTHLGKRMLEELQRRNYSQGTTRAYLQAVQQFAVHFGKSPDKLEPDDLKSYQAYLLVERWTVAVWRDYLAASEGQSDLAAIRRCTHTGRLCKLKQQAAQTDPLITALFLSA